jgi:hypothetical protein
MLNFLLAVALPLSVGAGQALSQSASSNETDARLSSSVMLASSARGSGPNALSEAADRTASEIDQDPAADDTGRAGWTTRTTAPDGTVVSIWQQDPTMLPGAPAPPRPDAKTGRSRP